MTEHTATLPHFTYLLSDLGAVLLFPKDKTYKGKLNPLYAELSQQSNFRFFDHFELNDELLKTYDELKQKGMICYSITEGTIQNDPAIQPMFNRVFLKIYSAQSLRLSKQDPQLYVSLAEEIGIDAKHFLFIDDSESNCEAAKSAGMNVHLYTSNIEVMKYLNRPISSTTHP